MIGIPNSNDKDMNIIIHLIGAMGQVMMADPIRITDDLSKYLFSADESKYIKRHFRKHLPNAKDQGARPENFQPEKTP
jgi:hypothetical protein